MNDDIIKRKEAFEKVKHANVSGEQYVKDVSYLLSLNERMAQKLEIAEKALEQFTRGQFYRSTVNDTWGPMVHMKDEPWKIANEALIAIKALEE